MSNLNDSAFPVPLNPGSSYQGHGPADGFTKRERACIDLRIPESGDAELDALIRKAQRQEFAAKSAQAMLANQSTIDVFGGYNEISDESLFHADALISALERTDG